MTPRIVVGTLPHLVIITGTLSHRTPGESDRNFAHLIIMLGTLSHGTPGVCDRNFAHLVIIGGNSFS